MKYLVCYDIPEHKIRYKVVKCLRKVAYRLQYSVFLGEGNKTEIEKVRRQLHKLAEKSKDARILIIPLHENDLQNWWLYGTFLEDQKDYFIA